ncbi:uncharacterized protein PAC_10940 [Phialocephala subalpina]|uniref:Uncharacterized protein n=1 Tax=Phialocephala subalpina TaxID=576137 RepID=A0A1L7X7Q2_9HELO|nr:uncharacterized protein PAC_10940 [Phialocephala subalpina]
MEDCRLQLKGPG